MKKILIINLMILILFTGCSESITDTIYYESNDASIESKTNYCEKYAGLNKVEGRYESGIYEIKLGGTWISQEEIMESCKKK